MNSSSPVTAALAAPSPKRPPPPKPLSAGRPQPEPAQSAGGIASRAAQSLSPGVRVLSAQDRLDAVRSKAATPTATAQRLAATVPGGVQALLSAPSVGKTAQTFIGQDWALLRADLEKWLEAAAGEGMRQVVTECVDLALQPDVPRAARATVMALALGCSATKIADGLHPVRPGLGRIAGTLAQQGDIPEVARDHAMRNIVLVCGLAASARALAAQPGTPTPRRQALELFAQEATQIAAHDTRNAGAFGLALVPRANAAATLKNYLDGWCRGASQPAGAPPARVQPAASLRDDEAPPSLLRVRRDGDTPVHDRKMTVTEADFTTLAGGNSSVERTRTNSNESVGADDIPTFHQHTPLVKPHAGTFRPRE